MANSENKISLGRYPINRKDNFWSARVAGAAMAVVGGLVGCRGAASTPETPHYSPSPTPSISQETPVKPDFPWKGSSSVEITKVSQGIGGGEIQPVGTLTPEDQPVVEAIKAAAKDGRILTMEGKAYVVSKPLTGEIVCFHNNRTGKDWQVVRAEGVDGFFLPTDYLVPDGTEEKVLVFIPNPSPDHPISLLANWGVVLAEGDNPQAWIYPEGRIPKMIVGINPDFKPEPFPATFEIRPVQAGEKIELSRYLESSKNNQVSYVKESWNVDQSDFPQDLTVVGMASDGWIKVMGTEKTGQKTTFWLQLTKEKLFEPGKPSGPIMVLGNWLAVPEIDLPSEFQKLLEAEKGPDISKSPRIEGLKATLENGQIVYRAEAGNQYGLKEGEIAGKITSFNVARNVESSEAASAKTEKTGGIILHPNIVKSLFLAANTPEALAAGKWKIPLFFVGAEKYTILEVNNKLGFALEFKDIPEDVLKNVQIVSPYPENSAFSFTKKGAKGEIMHGIGLSPADSFVPEVGINWGVGVYYGEGKTPLKNYEVRVAYDESLVYDLSDAKLPSPPFAKGIQLCLTIGTLQGGRNIGLDNLLSLDGYIVSMMK